MVSSFIGGKWFAMAALLLSTVFGIYVGTMSTDQTSNEKLTQQLKKSTDIEDEWIQGLKKVYQLTLNTEVKDEIIHISKLGIVAVPKENSYIPERTVAKNEFVVMPFTSNDTGYAPWNELLADGSLATYTGDHVLLLNDTVKISKLIKGTTLAHKLMHRTLDPNGVSLKKAMAYCHEEVMVQTFENTLFLQMAGPKYQELIDKRTDELILQAKGVDTNPASRYKEYFNALDDMFGPSLSREESIVKRAALETAAVFQQIDRGTGADKDREKAEYMCNMYNVYEGIPGKG